MQLVGATKRFIQKPFLVNNIFLSVLACFVGNLILILVLILLIDKIPEMKSFISLNQLIYLTIITSFLNLGISFFSTLICVRKYLNLKTDDLYK